MANIFNELIAKLVDQRINHLLPCIKERILKGEEPIIPVASDILHKGIACTACNINPITGFRYECPKCPKFNLCETCEPKINHDHNLLKVKKSEEEKLPSETEEFKKLRQCFRGFFKSHHRRHGSSDSQERSPRKWRGHHQMKKLWGLSFLYGG